MKRRDPGAPQKDENNQPAEAGSQPKARDEDAGHSGSERGEKTSMETIREISVSRLHH